jgi:hypothetical protein
MSMRAICHCATPAPSMWKKMTLPVFFPGAVSSFAGGFAGPQDMSSPATTNIATRHTPLVIPITATLRISGYLFW